MADTMALPQRINSRQRKRQQQKGEGDTERTGSTLRPDCSPGVGSGSDGGGGARDAAANGGSTGQAASDGLQMGPSDAEAPQHPGPGPGSQRDGGSNDDVLQAYRSGRVGSYKFEYLDHTADVQIHAWGRDLAEAFEQCALGMMNYMSPLEHVRQRDTRVYRAEGHDLSSLLFAFLDELLFEFNTELFLAAAVTITAFDREAFTIEAEGRGETFDRSVHEVGTEVKAITYSAMSITEAEGDAEVFVIVDI